MSVFGAFGPNSNPLSSLGTPAFGAGPTNSMFTFGPPPATGVSLFGNNIQPNSQATEEEKEARNTKCQNLVYCPKCLHNDEKCDSMPMCGTSGMNSSPFLCYMCNKVRVCNNCLLCGKCFFDANRCKCCGKKISQTKGSLAELTDAVLTIHDFLMTSAVGDKLDPINKSNSKQQ